MKIYFVGICGVMMGPLAVSMHKRGFIVEGSDKGFYPPISTYLQKRNILMHIGYKAEHVPEDIAVAVIGPGMGLKSNPEVEKIQRMKCRVYYGYGEFLHDYYEKSDSIVVTGTYGKTSITAFTAFLLEKANVRPTYAIGGIAHNFPDSVYFSDTDVSVFEGDEYIISRQRYEPRFLTYSPTSLIINAAAHDHLDVYETEESYIHAFRQLLGKMKPGSKVYLNKSGENSEAVIAQFRDIHTIIEIDPVSHNAPIHFLAYKSFSDYTEFELEAYGKQYKFHTALIGTYTIRNLIMGLGVGIARGIPIPVLQDAVRDFKGIKRRLEVRKRFPYMVIDDLAHSPIKAKGTITSLRQSFPEKRIIAAFEPHTISLRLKSSLQLFTPDMFKDADEVLIAPLYHPDAVPGEERVTNEEIGRAIGTNARSFKSFIDMEAYIREHIREGDILVFMSSGAFGNLIEHFSADIPV